MRKQVARILRWQAEKYLQKHKPKVVIVSGSVGKTSTTQAISTVLATKFKVRSTLFNYNTDIGIPCSIFNQIFPKNIKNPLSWFWIIVKNQTKVLFGIGKVEALVLELGTDMQGELENYFWLKPEIAVVTAVSQEHMEFFKTIENVAKEELSVAKYSSKTIINKIMVDSRFLKYADTDQLFNYSREDIKHIGLKSTDLAVIGDHSLDAVSAALAIGKEFGMSLDELKQGIVKIKPQPGRMNPLKGVMESLLIDDTYNSSPEAVRASLTYLYNLKAPQKIAVLGNMNELGAISEYEHRKIGEYCDPKNLDLVVTLGPDANLFTAEAARGKGCNVIVSKTPYEAAKIVKDNLKEKAVVLLKGSQNSVFAEETTKLLLENPSDYKKLVRQSDNWIRIKKENFRNQGEL